MRLLSSVPKWVIAYWVVLACTTVIWAHLYSNNPKLAAWALLFMVFFLR